MLLLISGCVVLWLLCGCAGYAIEVVVDEVRGNKDRFRTAVIFGGFTLLFALVHAIRKTVKSRYVVYGKPGYGQSFYVPPRNHR